MAIFVAPTQNFLSKTINGSITSNQTTITLSSTANMQAPGYVVIDRVDSAGNLTSSLREVVSYTGISSNDLTGCTRGADNGTGLAHSDGAIVETTLTTGMWNGLATAVSQFADTNGYINAINSPVSVAIGQFKTLSVNSIASIARVETSQLIVSNRIDVSAASVTGIGLYPVWRGAGAYSGATTAIGGILTAPKAATWSWISVKTRTVASGASVVFDVLNNGISIFAGVTKPTIVGGGTYVSTASINTKAISSGQDLRADIATLGVPGVITDAVIQGGTI